MKTLTSVDFSTSMVDGCYELYVTCGDCGRFAESDTQPVVASSAVHPNEEDGFFDETGWLRSHAERHIAQYECPDCSKNPYARQGCRLE